MTLGRYERGTEWPLTAAAVAFLVAYAWPILDTGLSSGLTATLETVTTVVWLPLGLDYALRVYLAPSRWAFIRGHPLDLAVLALPVLRPLRALRAIPVLLRLNDRVAVSFRGQVATYVAGAVSLVVSSPPLPSSTRSGAHPTRISPASVTPCGGLRPR